jgi:hypothetical protein
MHEVTGREEHRPLPGPEKRHPRENRWCDHWGYFIDLAACEARADRRYVCRRCLRDWRQLSFPFYK